MKVIKIGGGCLHGKKTIAEIVELLASRGRGNVVVVSALSGITDLLIQSMETARQEETAITGIISRLKNRHMLVARHLMPAAAAQRGFGRDFDRYLTRLERLYYGLNFTREITPRLYDTISSYGERFSAILLSAVMRSRGEKSSCRMPQEIGLITDGKFGDATADLPKTEKNFTARLLPTLNGRQITFVPGFFGVSQAGEITTFGRGGSDYSAAVVAAASRADRLEIWKDVDGFLSADPRFIPEATLIEELSYDEAAELAYFGAKILHPRTVEPMRRHRLPIEIRNTLHPDAVGSRITAKRRVRRDVVKSVTHSTDIGILKVHASGVGMRKGILNQVSARVAESGINIRSVVTSQTCISLLVALEDLEPVKKALLTLRPRPFRRLESVSGVALVCIVGEGLSSRSGIAARCFTAAAECRVNIEMIAFGPSPVALYFLVRRENLQKAVTAIHSHFFGRTRCQL
ncbi:MAG: aspartate kinase [Desulfobacterales bacterium]